MQLRMQPLIQRMERFQAHLRLYLLCLCLLKTYPTPLVRLMRRTLPQYNRHSIHRMPQVAATHQMQQTILLKRSLLRIGQTHLIRQAMLLRRHQHRSRHRIKRLPAQPQLLLVPQQPHRLRRPRLPSQA